MSNQKIIFYGLLVFLILIFALFISLSWLISEVNAGNACQLDPNIWCYNDWTCQNTCSGQDGTINSCYNQKEGLAECLFGLDSPQANFCTADNCPCVVPLESADNCFNGCPSQRNQINCSTLQGGA